MKRRALVIGATTPIGTAIVAALVADGCQVAGVSLEDKEIDGLDLHLTADCSEAAGADEAVGRVIAEFGGLDVLVAAAGRMPVEPAHRTTDAQWFDALANTLNTFFFPVRAALPALFESDVAAVVAVSSVNTLVSAPWTAAYTAAKGGVDALVRQLAVEYAGRGIRVNAVAPGIVGSGGRPDAAVGYPIGRTIEATEVADAVAFLAGPRAAAITGVVLPVDGGLSVLSPAVVGRADLQARLKDA
ncbi:NAD(P)-dependent dehydrogenase (short-subunit alcohol dehydrogenase family) [Kribbella sp. VKM Ac-2527]|uniref:NAD(P)-dependent dehydrogenase (Short-subunit alcohol dehydrogenase family) n=1 Tax=Kribbella caucasensis TaxID=2512215 RepID=A0A4R6KFY9_9ACTN|nr:SDR family oxidoreductase [Kribbella sp. VKM Ac-2527]TDO49166.1 NAD(P)-dependent dehydrogenase (short-subunit alcohol dehydrogenase family) [Kribbella sp. VKM Ac-2527]